ncbi:hypothetical protein SSX86_030029 [Deinandra increscens subsp. villosa]|uniref:Uncharacterized protein n=1 Tax=Deinandra increscens subsp. villosa TaxID=3103831 RepID=A0AAP0CBM4_9ASTR
MTINIDIFSKENIKPSSPTPPDLKSYNLSILDQLIPAPYAPIMLFYPNQDQSRNLDQIERQRILSIKDSLSETLTRFYPLAGTIKDDLVIDCNDVGACFVAARVNTRLDDFLKRPDLELINRFLPCEPSFNGSSAGSCVSHVQVTIFECCGIAISLCISHKILDGGALSTFLKSWAGSSYGSKEVVLPDMIGPSLFPAKDLWLKDFSIVMWGSLFKMGKCRTTRFVFDSTKIASLKVKAGENGLKDPTRVEVVSGLLWKCVMGAFEETTGSRKPSMLSHVVNLRKRGVPENAIGNMIFITSARCDNDSETGLDGLVGKIRDSVSRIDGEFVKKLLDAGDERIQVMEEALKGMMMKSDDCANNYIGFTSWCKLGFYEADFGWGKPLWVCGSVSDRSPVFMNFVVLMDTRNGNGIEAWVSLDEAEMHVLQHNPDLLHFASLDPSPILY